MVVRSNFVRGKSILEKGQKETKGQVKILGAASVICDQIYESWPLKGLPGNPVIMITSPLLESNARHRAMMTPVSPLSILGSFV